MKLYKKLLSGLCCVTLLVGLLPVFPAAAAEPTIKEDFESYSADADFGAGSDFINQSLPEGGTVTRTVKDGGSTKYLEMLAQGDGSRNRFQTRSTFSGTYTLEFDYNNPTGTRFDVYLRTGGSVRLLIDKTASITVLASAKTPQMDSVYTKSYLNGTHWYTMKVTVTDESITLDVYDKTNGMSHLETLSIIQDNSTLEALLDPYAIWFDLWGTSNAQVNLDNINITEGTYEGLLSTGSAPSAAPAPSAPAAPNAAFSEDFEGFSTNADYGAGEYFIKQDLPYGGITARTVKAEGDTKVLEMLTQVTDNSTDSPRNRFQTRNKFSGTYTLEFDYNNPSGVRFDVYLRTGGSIRLMLQPSGTVYLAVLDSAKVAGKMTSVSAKSTLDPSHWYTFKAEMSNEKLSVAIYDKTAGNVYVETLSIAQDNSTLPTLLDAAPIWFDLWGRDASFGDTRPAAVYLDNIHVTDGTYQGLLNGEVSDAPPPASGDEAKMTVLYSDDFEDYSPSRFGGNDAFYTSDIANGSTISRQIKQNEGNKYLWLAAQNAENTTTSPRVRLSGKEAVGAPFTVEFDYNASSKTRFDIYLRGNGAIRITVTDQLIPTIRVLDSAKVAGKMETAVGKNALKTNHWYTFKAVTTNETMTLEVFDKENGNTLVESLSIIQDNSTKADLFEPSVIWFDMWGYADKNITQVASVALDNVNIVSGTYEGLLNKDAKVGSIVGVTGDGLGSAVDLRDHECPSKDMIDVYISAWYHKAVDFALTNKLMGGYNAVQFGPNDTLTRAQVVQVLYNKEGQPAVSGKHDFTDVPASQWFNNAVTWGTQKKIMGGYGNGKFGPNDAVTIEQIAVILWQYAGKPEFKASADSVGTHSGWAANGLAWCVEKGILDGMPYDVVTDPATRAQTAQMLMNYLK